MQNWISIEAFSPSNFIDLNRQQRIREYRQ